MLRTKLRKVFLYVQKMSKMNTNVNVLKHLDFTIVFFQFDFFEAEVKLAEPCSPNTLKEHFHSLKLDDLLSPKPG